MAKRRKGTTVGSSYVEPRGLWDPTVRVIWDNGGQPFHVVDEPGGLRIYQTTMVVPYQGYFYGKDTSGLKEDGNSMLVRESDTDYLYIGSEIYRFSPGEEIEDYYSPMGNNGVPYPVAYGEKNVYFMVEKQLVPRAQMKTKATRANAEKIYAEFFESFIETAKRFKTRLVRKARY